MNNSPAPISDFNTRITLQVIDANGDILREVDDCNSETFWAKVSTPVTGTLYLDFITKDVSLTYGVTLAELTKTSFPLLTELRSSILTSSAFVLTGTTYAISFSYYNSTENTINLYGLLSYNDTRIYTVFDISSSPIEISPGSTVIGTYKITYESKTPLVKYTTARHNTIAGINKTYSGMGDLVSDEVKSYKLSRNFVKTKVYVGSDVTDTLFTSNIILTATYTSDTSTVMYKNYSGEILYKCLTSGNPGGATVNRTVLAPLIYTHIGESGALTFGEYYFAKFGSHQHIDSNVPYSLHASFEGGTYTCVKYNTITARNETPVSIYPHKVRYPSNVTEFDATFYANPVALLGGDWQDAVVADGSDSFQCMTNMHTPVGPPFQKMNTYINSSSQIYIIPDETATLFCQIMYWDSTPQLTLYSGSPHGIVGGYVQPADLHVYVGGIKLPCVISSDSNTNGMYTVKYSIDTTSLPASGSGVFVFYFMINRNDAFPRFTSFALCTNMYSYVVPYAGMLSRDSSTLSSGWISPSCLNIGGVDTFLTVAKLNPDLISTIAPIQNTILTEALQNVEYQYNVSVTEENFNELVGIIEKGNVGKIKHDMSYTYNGYSGTGYMNLYGSNIPYYVGESNFVHFGTSNVRTQNYGIISIQLASVYINPLYFKALYNAECNTSIAYNAASREVNYLNCKSFKYPTTNSHLDDIKLYAFREQGTSNYKNLIASNVCDYVEGTPTVVWGGHIYEFESTLQATENFGNINVVINPASVFSSNEYIGVPFASDTCLPVDSLEEWKVSSSLQVPKTQFSDDISEKYTSADALIDVYNTFGTAPTDRLAANSGELIECEVLLPNSTVQVEGTSYTHTLTFTVSWNSNEYQLPTIHIPKKLEKNGITLFTNVSTVYVTDGLHVIPWSLNHGCNAETKQVHQNSNYVWELVLNRTNLTQLYPTNTSLIVHAYVVAKQKSEWLPFDIDIKNLYNRKYYDNNGKDTLLLIHSNTTHGDLIMVNSASVQSSLQLVTSGANVSHSTTRYKFGSSSIYFSDTSAFLCISSDQGHCIGSPFFTSDITLDFWIRPTDISVRRTLLQFSTLQENVGWYMRIEPDGTLLIKEYAGYSFAIYDDPGNTGYATIAGTGYITVNNWHHIAVVVTNGFMHIYVNGARVYVYKSANVNGVNNLSIGPNYLGYIDEFHITRGALWLEDFIPPSYPWGSVELDTVGIEYVDKTLIPVELPVALDCNIDVINTIDGSRVSYIQTGPFNRAVSGSELSNELYLAANTIKYNAPDPIRLSYFELPIRTRESMLPAGNINGIYMGHDDLWAAHHTAIPTAVLDRYPIRTLSTSSSGNMYSFITDGKYRDLGYRFEQTAYFTDKVTTTVQVVESAQSNTSTPSTIFKKHINAGDIANYRVGTINASDVLQDSDHYKVVSYADFGNGILNGVAYRNAVVDIRSSKISVSLFSAYEPSDSQYYSADTQIISNNAITQRYTVHFGAHPLKNALMNKYNKISTNAFINNMHSSSLINVNSNTPTYYSSISIYYVSSLLKSEQQSLNLNVCNPGIVSNVYVDCADDSYISRKFPYSYSYINGYMVGVVELSNNPDKYLYTTNKTISPGDMPIFKINNPDIVSANTLDIYTYSPLTYEYEFIPYSNNAGSFILSDVSKTINYEVLFSNRFMRYEHSSYKWAFTKNTELINILNTSSLRVPYTIGYVSDSYEYQDTINKGTSYSASPTSVIAIEMPIFGSRRISIGSSVKLEAHSLTAFRDVYNCVTEAETSYFFENIRHLTYIVNTFQTHAWPDVTKNANLSQTGMCFTQYPYFNKYNLDELYLNTYFHSGVWESSSSTDVIGNTTAPIHCILTQGEQEYKTGILLDDAIQVDSRVLAKSNTTYNIIYDSNNIPVDDILRLGKFSLRTYTDEYGSGSVSYLPIVKINDNVNVTTSIFALGKTYGNIINITDRINSVNNDTINNVIVNRYKKNSFSFEGFNSLLDTYTGSEFTLTLGFIIYNPDLNRLCVFKGMSVEIEFINKAHYTRPEWCYVNENGVMSNTKDALISDVTNRIVKVYNPNDTNVIDYATYLDVSAYDFSTFTNGIVAKLPSAISIPTLYETDDHGHVSNEYSNFNGKGLWVKIPSLASKSTIDLTLNNLVNSSTVNEVFTTYEGFSEPNPVGFEYSKTYTASVTGADTSGGVGFESTSQRIMYVDHTLSIGIYNNSLVMSGDESTSIVTTSSSLPDDQKYEIRYLSDDTSNLEIAFGDIDNINYDTPLSYYNDLVDSNYTFVCTDIHKGANYFYVYYTSGTATDASDTSIFIAYQDFTDISVPGWYKYTPDKIAITPGNMTISLTSGRLSNGNSLSSDYSFGVIVRASGTALAYDGYLFSIATSDTTLSGIHGAPFSQETGLGTSLMYRGDCGQDNMGLGLKRPNTTVSSYYFNEYRDDLVSFEQYSAKTHKGKYYTLANTYGDAMYKTKSPNAYFNLGGTHNIKGFDAGGTTMGISYKLAAMYKGPSAFVHDPVYNAQETGSWVIDGHTFTNRKLIKVVANSNDTKCIIKFDRTQLNNATNLRITSTTHLSYFSNKTTSASFMLGSLKQGMVGLNAGTTELVPFWSSTSDSENMFIKTDLVKGDNTLYVYYTSGTATNGINGSAVFEFYENFADGVIDTLKWHTIDPFDGDGHETTVNGYHALLTPNCIRSRYLLSDNYNVMARAVRGNSTAPENTTLSIWDNAVDFLGGRYSSEDEILIPSLYDSATTSSIISRTKLVPYTIKISSNDFYRDKRGLVAVEGSKTRIDKSDAVVSTLTGALYSAGASRIIPGRYSGHIRFGSSPHYPNSSGVAIDSTCSWVAAWKRSKNSYNCVWSSAESGSWVVDGHTFTNRKKLIITSDATSQNEVVMIKQWLFGSLNTIRIIREKRTGRAFRYVDTHRTDTVFSFVPSSNNVSYSRKLLEDAYNMSDSESGLVVKTPSTGKLGITASTGSVDKKVYVRWIRSRKHYPLELVQFKIEDVSILIKSTDSDWYMFDTTAVNVKAANTANITSAISSNAIKNHDSVFLEKWVKFPSSDYVKNKHYGFGRHISYRN